MVNDVLACIGPGQFKDIWNRTVERSGEQMLMLAMLAQAVEDLDHYRAARRPDHQRIFAQTSRWIAATDRTWPYSFVSICEMFDLPRAAIRARLLIEDGHAHAGRILGSLRRRSTTPPYRSVRRSAFDGRRWRNASVASV
jgi:hypothetical protein